MSMRASLSAGILCSRPRPWASWLDLELTGTSWHFADSPAVSPPMVDPRPRRLSALVGALTVAHVDGLLVTSLPNIRYLTGFSGSSALLFVAARDAVLITDFRYQTQIKEEVGDLARVIIQPQSLWAGLWQQLQQLSNLEVAGFESG